MTTVSVPLRLIKSGTSFNHNLSQLKKVITRHIDVSASSFSVEALEVKTQFHSFSRRQNSFVTPRRSGETEILVLCRACWIFQVHKNRQLRLARKSGQLMLDRGQYKL